MAKRRRRARRLRRIIGLVFVAALVIAGTWLVGAATKRDDPVAAVPAGKLVLKGASKQRFSPYTEETGQTGGALTPEEEARIKEVQERPFNLLLANAGNKLPDDFTVETEAVQGIYKMDTRVAPIMRQMIADAKADGVDLLVCSAYRSISKQKELFSNKVNEYLSLGKSKEEADRLTATIIAVPGTSEHHTGLSADIVTPAYQSLDEGFESTAAFAWLNEHAHEYGFVLRYPKDKQEITGIIYEPWHYRYVGKDHAAYMRENSLCLEEYLGEAKKGAPVA